MKNINQQTILRIKGVIEKTGLPRSSIYEKITKKEFPEPVSLGDRAVGWVSSEIDEWISSRISQSRGGE